MHSLSYVRLRLRQIEKLCKKAKDLSNRHCYCSLNSNDMKGPCHHCQEHKAYLRVVLQGRRLVKKGDKNKKFQQLAHDFLDECVRVIRDEDGGDIAFWEDLGDRPGELDDLLLPM